MSRDQTVKKKTKETKVKLLTIIFVRRGIRRSGSSCLGTIDQDFAVAAAIGGECFERLLDIVE